MLSAVFFLSAIVDVEELKTTLKVVGGSKNVFCQISQKLLKILLLCKLMKLAYHFAKNFLFNIYCKSITFHIFHKFFQLNFLEYLSTKTVK